MRTVYLLHLHHPSAPHPLGWPEHLDERLARHRAGTGARLIEAITAAGIGFSLACTSPGDRALKRPLNKARLRPVCREALR
jgi:hypothetical protein